MQKRHGFCTFPFVKHLCGLVIVSKLSILKDYKKKSSKVFIETDSIGYATSYAGKQIPADKIIPDIKKLMKTNQILQCKEDFEGVARLELIVRFLMVLHLGILGLGTHKPPVPLSSHLVYDAMVQDSKTLLLGVFLNPYSSSE
jgi:hypothetical protein